MISTVNSLKDLYVKLGGSLTDTYEGIANGVPVADYNVIPDMIEAITQKAGSGGGGGSGLSVIECVLTEDIPNEIYTLSNAGALWEAFENILLDPKESFGFVVIVNYNGVVYNGTCYISANTVNFFNFNQQSAIISFYSYDDVSIADVCTVFTHYTFEKSNIDSSGVATLNYIGD